jgi:anti-anti-sigma factor
MLYTASTNYIHERQLNGHTLGVAYQPDTLDHFPVPVQVFQLDGTLASINRQCAQLFEIDRTDLVGSFNVLQSPLCPGANLAPAFRQVASGETETAEVSFLYEQDDRSLWVQATCFPIRNEQATITHIAAIYQDLTALLEYHKMVEAADNEVLRHVAATHATRAELDRQCQAIVSLASPVIQVWDGILTVPLIGEIDQQRFQQMSANLLDMVEATGARVVILDVTGVTTIDHEVANNILALTHSCQMLGSEVVLVGVNPVIARVLVQLTVDLSNLTIQANLQAGIAWALEHIGLMITHRRSASRQGRGTRKNR